MWIKRSATAVAAWGPRCNGGRLQRPLCQLQRNLHERRSRRLSPGRAADLRNQVQRSNRRYQPAAALREVNVYDETGSCPVANGTNRNLPRRTTNTASWDAVALSGRRLWHNRTGIADSTAFLGKNLPVLSFPNCIAACQTAACGRVIASSSQQSRQLVSRSRLVTRKTYNNARASLVEYIRAVGLCAALVIQRPAIIVQWCQSFKASLIHGLQWTKKGFLLFAANFRISLLLVKKKVNGQPLTLREHKLLVRTTTDFIKLIPFSFFVVVPFAELLLPIALWCFPGMLPSTFADRNTDKPQLKRKLKAKQELAAFFQELVAERTRQILEETTSEKKRDRALLLKDFQEKLILKAREEEAGDGEDVNPFLDLKDTLTYAKLFREEFKLEKMPTKSLMVLCQMLGLHPYAIRANVILQLRHHILQIQREDREILWEGVDSLTHDELVDACKERAMRFYGVSDDVMREQMQQWLELSSHMEVPPLLLLWSRSITMTHCGSSGRRLQTGEVAAASGQSGSTPSLGPISADDLMPQVEQEQYQSVATPSSETGASISVTPATGPAVPRVSPHVTPLADARTAQEQQELSRKMQQQQLQADLEEVDRRLAELKTTADLLEQETSKPEPGVVTTATSSDQIRELEVLRDTTSAFHERPTAELIEKDREIERNKGSKAEMLEKQQRLMQELSILHDVSERQHKHVSDMIQSLVLLIDEYKGWPDSRATNIPAEKLQALLDDFERDEREVSTMLEQARNIDAALKENAFCPKTESGGPRLEDDVANSPPPVGEPQLTSSVP